MKPLHNNSFHILVSFPVFVAAGESLETQTHQIFQHQKLSKKKKTKHTGT